MTTQTEALKQLLEALDKELPHNMKHIAAGQRFNARTALAQPSVPQGHKQEPKCNSHPKAPHGFNRNASHANDRYTCECEGWDAYDAGYQAGVMAGIEASMGQEPEQEPVAHVCVFPLRGDEFFPQTRIEWKNGRPVAGPLYTTPPQRKPLTDDREAFKRYIEECDECAIVPDVAGAFNAGWRAAHGIKE